ncbi:MAG: LysE family translocator [bacterium]
MTTSLIFSMVAFALVTSISPGPVNIVALRSGTQYGFRASMRHVTGATLGFSFLLLLTGLGLHELLGWWPDLMTVIQWAGVAFLLFMAFRLVVDNGQLNMEKTGNGPSLLYGAAMQWLNPKAWLASLAGMGAYVASGEVMLVWQFTMIYFLVCYVSIAAWAYSGAVLRRFLREPCHVRWFNRLMAALLAASAVYLIQT